MSRLDEAKAELYAAAQAYQPGKSDTRLLIAAVAVARALRHLADGVPAAEHQARRDEARGVRDCPHCGERVAPLDGQWVNLPSNKPHRCVFYP